MWIWVLAAISLLLSFLTIKLFKRVVELERLVRSMRVKRGMNIEQMLPLTEEYPYDAHGFRFLGNPIDGIQFNDDSIVLVEFKSGKSKLSEKQKRIKSIVENGKVYFKVFRIR